MGDKISLASGIKPGEQVVASGVFMLDSTFNIQGKVSLIDPNRAVAKNETKITKDPAEEKEIEEAFSELSPEDRKLAETQEICPVTEVRLGTLGMGAPIKVVVKGTPIMICCEGCRDGLLEEPDNYFAILEDYHKGKLQPAKNAPENKAPSSAELPQMELPKMELPKMELPGTEAPK